MKRGKRKKAGNKRAARGVMKLETKMTRRNRKKETLPTGYKGRKAYNRIDRMTLIQQYGPGKARVALQQLEKKLFARKSTERKRDGHRVRTPAPNRKPPSPPLE